MPAPLTDELRRASRQVHDVSDALVNARLLALFTSRSLYAHAIGCFWGVYVALEAQLEKHRDDPGLAPFSRLLAKMQRRQAFATDLQYYLGDTWQAQVESAQSDAVKAYASHLARLGDEDPVLLLSHAYTQYMAMIAGGQIIRRAARKHMRLPEDKGTAAFEFTDGTSNELRSAFKAQLNGEAEGMRPQTTQRLVEEHCTAFRLNNGIIRSFNIGLLPTLHGAALVLPKWLVALALLLLALLAWGAASLLMGLVVRR